MNKKSIANDAELKAATTSVQQTKQKLNAAEIANAAAQDQKNDTQAIADKQRAKNR